MSIVYVLVTLQVLGEKVRAGEGKEFNFVVGI